MELQILSTRGLAKLRAEIDSNIGCYCAAGSSPLHEQQASNIFIRTNLTLNGLPELLPSQKGSHSDFENSKRLHQSLSVLNPVQATDERFWTYLAHASYWGYMTSRWAIDPDNIESARNKIERRYFVRGSGLRGVALNGLSRLWWAAHLTIDRDREDDPYWLTRVFFGRSDIATGLLERDIGKSKVLLRSILVFLDEYGQEIYDEWKGKGGFGRAIQKMVREINRAGGVVLLDALKSQELHGILIESVFSD